MNIKYTVEMNILMTIGLLKAHGVKNMIISPGGTNVCFATSVMNDGYFNLYSCVDERSAAYMACGIAEETGEPVVWCCTGATASRNYVPALTEAYYRKLPILVITTSQFEGKVGHLFPQVTDRSAQMNDIICYSTHIPCKIEGKDNRWFYNTEINKAILALTYNGGGPSHINLATDSSISFGVETLPEERVIKRYTLDDSLPELHGDKIGVYVGSHGKWSKQLTEEVEKFCERYNAVVLCDHTSNYHGKYKVEACIATTQIQNLTPLAEFDVMIHIGDVSGAYMNLAPKKVWRVNPDGEVRDTFYKLENVFHMSEMMFFNCYTRKKTARYTAFYDNWNAKIDELRCKIPELPLSNAWIAQITTPRLPQNCEIHFGILNSLRSWNYFHIDDTIDCFSNTGGFGIDGCVSSLIGASVIKSDKIYIGIVGDLAFFYDMNSLGIRHIGPNMRLIVVNNGCGAEFHIPACVTKRAGMEKEEINRYTSAQGHYGGKSRSLIRGMAESLGFEYFSVETKEEYMNCIDDVVAPPVGQKPILVEVFTESDDDAFSIKILTNLEKSTKGLAKEMAKSLLGAKNVQRLKDAIRK